MENKRLLIISAHADDHISCAGTVFKLQTEFGFKAFELVFTNSSLGQNFRVTKEIDPKQVTKTRSKELGKAQKFLGIVKSFNLNMPDLDLKYSQEIVFSVVKVIREVRPQIIFIHNPYDAHPDHKASYEISLTAIKVAAMGVLKETLGPSFRVPQVLCAEGMLPIKSQILVDITSYKKRRDKLFRFYVSQANSKAVSFEGGLAAVRGYHLRKVDGLFAEAFTLQEEFPILFFEK